MCEPRESLISKKSTYLPNRPSWLCHTDTVRVFVCSEALWVLETFKNESPAFVPLENVVLDVGNDQWIAEIAYCENSHFVPARERKPSISTRSYRNNILNLSYGRHFVLIVAWVAFPGDVIARRAFRTCDMRVRIGLDPSKHSTADA